MTKAQDFVSSLYDASPIDEVRICGNCGSEDIKYRMAVWLDVNDVENKRFDFEKIAANLEHDADNSLDRWCNACNTHCTIVLNCTVVLKRR